MLVTAKSISLVLIISIFGISWAGSAQISNERDRLRSWHSVGESENSSEEETTTSASAGINVNTTPSSDSSDENLEKLIQATRAELDAINLAIQGTTEKNNADVVSSNDGPDEKLKIQAIQASPEKNSENSVPSSDVTEENPKKIVETAKAQLDAIQAIEKVIDDVRPSNDGTDENLKKIVETDENLKKIVETVKEELDTIQATQVTTEKVSDGARPGNDGSDGANKEIQSVVTNEVIVPDLIEKEPKSADHVIKTTPEDNTLAALIMSALQGIGHHDSPAALPPIVLNITLVLPSITLPVISQSGVPLEPPVIAPESSPAKETNKIEVVEIIETTINPEPVTEPETTVVTTAPVTESAPEIIEETTPEATTPEATTPEATTPETTTPEPVKEEIIVTTHEPEVPKKRQELPSPRQPWGGIDAAVAPKKHKSSKKNKKPRASATTPAPIPAPEVDVESDELSKMVAQMTQKLKELKKKKSQKHKSHTNQKSTNDEENLTSLERD